MYFHIEGRRKEYKKRGGAKIDITRYCFRIVLVIELNE